MCDMLLCQIAELSPPLFQISTCNINLYDSLQLAKQLNSSTEYYVKLPLGGFHVELVFSLDPFLV